MDMDNDALINGYFEGSLSAAQKEDLDRLLKTDPEFIADFEFQRELKESLKKDERQQIKNMLSEVKVDKKKSESKVITLRPWLVAASAVFLVGISAWLFFFNDSGFDTNQLYDSNFVPYYNVVHPIERGQQLEDLKTKAFAAYEDEDYGHSLELFKELQQKQTDSYIEFYKAIILMQLNKPQEAIPLLESYIASGGELKDRATWYLALAHLKLEDVNQSKLILERVVNQNGYNVNAAKELLESLD